MFLALVFAVLNFKWGKFRRLLTGFTIFGALFVVALAGSERGRKLAKEDIFDTSPRLPNVGFVSKAKAKDGDPSCLTDGTMDCKLLLHAKGTYYFFQPVQADSASSGGQLNNLNVYVVADSEIVNVHVSPGCGANQASDFETGSCK